MPISSSILNSRSMVDTQATPSTKAAIEIMQSRWFEDAMVQSLQKQYLAAQPYPHVVLDGFLHDDVALALYNGFPKLGEMATHYDGMNEKKAEDSGFERYPQVFRDLRAALFSKTFTTFLERVTGIEDIRTCEGALGSGTHQGGNGSFLDIHVDFNIHPTENLHRRINVLVFLNKNWQESYGGKLEMWNKDMTACVAAHLPLLNRCVIFETNDISYHGYGKITVPDGESRKSVYAYYYTPLDKSTLVYHDTTFRTRPNEPAAKKLQTAVKETSKNFIKRQLKHFGLIDFYNKTWFKFKTRGK